MISLLHLAFLSHYEFLLFKLTIIFGWKSYYLPEFLPYTGVYAGDPSKLSMKAAFGKVWRLEKNGGSVIGGTFKALQERKSASKPPRDP